MRKRPDNWLTKTLTKTTWTRLLRLAIFFGRPKKWEIDRRIGQPRYWPKAHGPRFWLAPCCIFCWLAALATGWPRPNLMIEDVFCFTRILPWPVLTMTIPKLRVFENKDWKKKILWNFFQFFFYFWPELSATLPKFWVVGIISHQDYNSFSSEFHPTIPKFRVFEKKRASCHRQPRG